jgi:transcription termination factor Rho
MKSFDEVFSSEKKNAEESGVEVESSSSEKEKTEEGMTPSRSTVRKKVVRQVQQEERVTDGSEYLPRTNETDYEAPVKTNLSDDQGEKPVSQAEIEKAISSSSSELSTDASSQQQRADENQPKQERERSGGRDRYPRSNYGKNRSYDPERRERKPISEMVLAELIHHARRMGVLGAGLMNRELLLEKIAYIEAHPDAEMEVEGILEKLPDGFGFLRSNKYGYTSSPDDVYVSPSQIRRFGLRSGDVVRGVIRKLRDEERYFALLKVTQLNYEDPLKMMDRLHFDNLTPIYPHQKFNLEFDPTAIATRLMDLFTPIGHGQRGLIVAPPKVGKTMLLKELARALIANHPNIFLIVLLIDERPEEVADMKRVVKGALAEVVSSTFDETAERHVQVAEIVLEKAKRLVECKKDVVIILDSITRLARAYNTIAPASGKVLTGGIDANALQRPKRFFGAARCTEEAGSLTIIASALVETGSRMDEVIFEEFKGTGNMEMNLTRKLSNRRVYPAFDILASGTRREELLLNEEELNKVWVLQKFLSTMNTVEGMEFLIEKIKKTKTNDEFLEALAKRSSTNGSGSGH